VPVIERSVSALRNAEGLSGVVKRNQRATFAIIVDNEPGVSHRVVGLFAARGYNIESLAVADTADGTHLSRITIVTSGAPEVLEQIHAQLKKQIAAREVHDVTGDPLGLERELAIVKVRGNGTGRTEAL
jgi:acetolactate synthase I/III small subunit